MEAKSCKIASGGSPLCELRSLHAFCQVFVDFVYFHTLKIGVFCGRYCKFEFFAFVAVSSPSALLDLILESF